MANANLYTDFRRDINDASTPYTYDDATIFEVLDAGIDFVSSKVDYTFQETHSLTQPEITQGYFLLAREPITLNSTDYNFTNYGFEFAGGRKIRIINTDGYSPTSYSFNYRARYKKFNGAMLEETDVDLPLEYQRAVRLYAMAELKLNYYGFDAEDPTNGVVKSKSEENLKVEYATESSSPLAKFTSPDNLKKRALAIVMRGANAHNPFFSTQL